MNSNKVRWYIWRVFCASQSLREFSSVCEYTAGNIKCQNRFSLAPFIPPLPSPSCAFRIRAQLFAKVNCVLFISVLSIAVAQNETIEIGFGDIHISAMCCSICPLNIQSQYTNRNWRCSNYFKMFCNLMSCIRKHSIYI